MKSNIKDMYRIDKREIDLVEMYYNWVICRALSKHVMAINTNRSKSLLLISLSLISKFNNKDVYNHAYPCDSRELYIDTTAGEYGGYVMIQTYDEREEFYD